MPLSKPDKAFLADMIPHHKAALVMANKVIKQSGSGDGTVLKLAKNIVSTQTAEIKQMESIAKGGGLKLSAKGGAGHSG